MNESNLIDHTRTTCSLFVMQGDKDFSRELLTIMTNSNIPVDKYTAQVRYIIVQCVAIRSYSYSY